jgi:hypothetical protein
MSVLELQTGSEEVLRHATISEKAYQIWMERDCPTDSANRDWLEAEDLIVSEALDDWEDSSGDA